MIRKIIISVLLAVCIVTLAGWGLAWRGATLMCNYFPPGPASYGGTVLLFTDNTVRFSCRKRCDAVQSPVEYMWGGFAFHDEVQTPGTHPVTVKMRVTKISAPAWAVAFLFGWYPALAFIRGPLRRWRRPQKGLCPNCGYDLTGNVSGTCPECGESA
jgi:hypothetical protein